MNRIELYGRGNTCRDAGGSCLRLDVAIVYCLYRIIKGSASLHCLLELRAAAPLRWWRDRHIPWRASPLEARGQIHDVLVRRKPSKFNYDMFSG